MRTFQPPRRRAIRPSASVGQAAGGSALFLSALVLGCAQFAAPARAQTSWTDGTGNWFVGTNWSAGVPNGATPATTVGNGGTAQINAAANAGASLAIAGGSTVDLQAGGSLTAGALDIGSSGTLLLSGSTALTGNVALGGGTLRSATSGTLTNAITFANSTTSTISAAAGQTLTLNPSNLVLGSGGFGANAKFGSATDTGAIVVGPSTFSFSTASTIEVVGGTLRAGNPSTLSFTAGNIASTTVDAGATLDLNGFFMTVRSLQGGGTVTTGGAALNLGAVPGNSDFSGAITGTGALIVNGGTTTLTGTNTYTGGTTIAASATLVLGSGGSILGSVANSANLSINGGGTLNLSGTLTTGAVASVTRLGGGTLRATSTSTVTDAITFLDGTTSTISAAAGQTLTLTLTPNKLTLGSGAGANAKFGSATDTGVVVVGPANGFSANSSSTIEVVGGTLRAGSSSTLGFFTSFIASTTVDAGATLDINGFDLAVRSLQGGGTVTTGGGTLILGNGGSVSNFSGATTGTGALIVNGGTTTLTGTNTYTGGTTILAGAVLTLGSGGSILGSVANSGNLNINSGGTLNLSGTLSGVGASVTTLAGGTLRATSSSSVGDAISLAGGTTSTISAAAGQTLALTPNSFTLGTGGVGANVKFGSATDTGVVLAGTAAGLTDAGASTIEVVGGTLRAGDTTTLDFFTSFVPSTTVDAGATLDLNGFNLGVKSLQGGGTVTTGGATLILGRPFGGGNSNFSGAITGTGALAVNGGGSSATLTGTNTYTGGTTIAAGGTLQLGNGGAGGSILGDVTDNGLLIFDRSDSTTFAGAISGAGALQQNGPGKTILTGASNYTGATAVNAGILDVNGSLTSTVTVNNGGTLMGNGTVGGLVLASGGTVAPGNSIGTLNVSGNASFAAGSIYQVEANAAAQADKIAATGTATISGGTVQVLASFGNYAPSTRYTILTANGGVAGTFGNVTSNFAFLAPSLSYDANDVFLTLARNATFFSGVAQTPNQRAVAGVLDASPLGSALVGAVVLQSAAGAGQAFDALSGEIHASAQTVMLDDSRYLRQAVLGRMRQASFAAGAGPMAALGAGGPQFAYAEQDESPLLAYAKAPEFPVKASRRAAAEPPAFGWWAQGVGAWGRINSDGGAAGTRRNLEGFFTGVDRRLGDNWLAGIAAGYTNASASASARMSSATIETAHVAGYADASYGPWSLRSAAAFSWSRLDTSRSIQFPGFLDTAMAHYDAGTAQAFGEIGYGLALGNLAAEPFAGVAYVHLQTNSFAETGGTGVAALAGAADKDDIGYSTLGLRAATNFALQSGLVLTPRVSAAWQHALGTVTPSAALVFQSTGAGFAISGVPIARDSALIEAGYDVRINPQVTFGLFYAGELAKGAQDHSVKGNFTWQF